MSIAPPVTSVPNLTGAQLSGDDRILKVRDNSTGVTVEVPLSALATFLIAQLAGQNLSLGILNADNVNAGNLSTQFEAFLQGDVYMPDLDTSDPVVAGQVWNNAGTLSVSAG